MGGINAYAETRHPDVVPAASGLRDVLADNNYEPSNYLSDVDAEFVDFDGTNEEIDGSGGGRRLQSATTTTKCNTWCKLKESLGLTIFGLILICVR